MLIADETETQVACGPRMIARQNPQAAGGDRQGFVETDFGGEIGDGIAQQGRCVFLSPGLLVRHVGFEAPQDFADPAREVRVLQADFELVFRDLLHHRNRVVVEVLPAAGRKLVEDLLRILVPGPPEVRCQSPQTRDQLCDFI